VNAHGIMDVRQNETHAVVPLVHEPNSFEDETAIEKLRR